MDAPKLRGIELYKEPDRSYEMCGDYPCHRFRPDAHDVYVVMVRNSIIYNRSRLIKVWIAAVFRGSAPGKWSHEFTALQPSLKIRAINRVDSIIKRLHKLIWS